MLAALGFLRLGTFIKFMPFPVTVGFTAGIAVIIFASQIRELLGLTLASEPGPILEKLAALWQVRDTLTPGGGRGLGGTLAIISAQAAAPALAGHADRRGRGCGRDGAARAAGRDDRHALRRHPLDAAGTGAADLCRPR
jgi:hypothetical protein